MSHTGIRPRVIALDLPETHKRAGGIIAADANGDGLRDFIVTTPGAVAVYDNSGRKLWVNDFDILLDSTPDINNLPNIHAPNIQITDIDRDGLAELLFLEEDNILHIVRASDGEPRFSIALRPPPPGGAPWRHLAVANLRGTGDFDLLLQATNAAGYRTGRYLAAFAIEELIENGADAEPLWTFGDFIAASHSGARPVDLDGDGRDEVAGGTLISSDGRVLLELPVGRSVGNHVDSVTIADIRPELPGLEVVVLEEGGENRVFLYNGRRVLWTSHRNHDEPQNAAVGNFDPVRQGREIWCRSRFNVNQRPFVFDSEGRLIAEYRMEQVAPSGWTEHGVEVIAAIHWTGDDRQLAAAKGRHKVGDVAIFDPISGRFLYVFDEDAMRLYVADVSGDWREEVIVLTSNQVHIYENPEPDPNPDRDGLWSKQYYKRSKTIWNYYNP